MIFGKGRNTPNRIDTVNVPGYAGVIGLVACPGIRVGAMTPSSKKNLPVDVQEIIDWGANGVVCFLEAHELAISRVEALPTQIQESGMWWRLLPIVDMGVPDQHFEDDWAEEGELIRHALRIGERVIFHCYAGLGRTGMMAARVLVEMGMDPEEAIVTVRQDNSRRIQNKKQEDLVRSCRSLYHR